MTRRETSHGHRATRMAFVSNSLDVGGMEHRMLTLARGLIDAGYRVDFILLVRDGLHGPLARGMGCRVHVLGMRRLERGSVLLLPWRLVQRVFHIARFAWIVRRQQYQVLDAWQYQSCLLAGLSRPLTRVPVLIAGRGVLARTQPRTGPHWRLLARLATRFADAVVANSVAVQHDLLTHEPYATSKVRVIRNGVEAATPVAPEDRRLIRARLGAEDEHFLIGCVSIYRPGKGLELLVSAAGALCTEYPQLRVALVGEGPLQADLARAIAEAGLDGRVRLHGVEPDARKILPAFDLFVHPSEAEGIPNAVLEAAAAGLAIVATDAGGTGEIVEDGQTGLLVPVGDRAALLTAIASLIEAPARREALGFRARERASSEFGVDRMIAEYASLYGELLERHGARLDSPD